MVYTYQRGLTKERMGRLSMMTIAGLLAVTTSLAVFNRAGATPATFTNVALTQSELDTNWAPDRQTPSGGFNSVASFAGRTDVAELRVDNTLANTSGGGFYQTEGIKRQVTPSDVVKADLYVDPAWQGKDVRAGLWAVAFDSATYNTSNISAYPIIEFTTVGDGGFTGWRMWDGVNGGWTNLPGTSYQWGSWYTLSISLNKNTGNFDYTVNGVSVGSNTAGDSANIGEVILNEKNFATDDHADDYAAHWSNFAYGMLTASPESKDDCKKDGWKNFGYTNQGLCIQYFNTGKDSRPQY